jgi:hypothetical protein
LILDAKQLATWLSMAEAGDRLDYHRGFLVIDRDLHASRLTDRERQELNRVADALSILASEGRGYLLQRRYGDGDYSYRFVYRPPFFPAKRAWLLRLEEQSS